MLVNWGLAMTHFQVCVGHFFLFQTHLITELHAANMPPRKLPEYTTLHILTEEARAEVVLLRVKMYRSLTDVEFDRISKWLTLLLQLLRYRKANPPPL